MAGTTGLEPAASAVTGQRSNQLNYVPSSSSGLGIRFNHHCATRNRGRREQNICHVFCMVIVTEDFAQRHVAPLENARETGIPNKPGFGLLGWTITSETGILTDDFFI